jgi:amino acid adenylation domain-containing protein
MVRPVVTTDTGQDLVARFDAVVARYPREVAIADERGRECSYERLRARAHHLATTIAALSVDPGQPVAVAMGNSIELVTAELAALCADRPYLPLDPLAPLARRRLLLDDAAAGVVVTDPVSWPMDERHAGVRWIDLDDVGELDRRTGGEGPDLPPLTNDRAYVMYTSGSTGRPKGVAVSRRSIVSLVVGNDYVRLDDRPVVAMAAPASFDASTFEVWGALLNGGTIRILSSPILSRIGPMLRLVARERPTVAFLTTALFERLARHSPRSLQDVDRLLFGGERCDPAVVLEFRDRFRGELVHVYGPTETTTFATAYAVPSATTGESQTTIPVGRAIRGVCVQVWDGAGDPVADGVSGEVVIGGAGLAEGYLGDPRLTNRRFVQAPDPAGDMRRWYRTGDIGRWNTAGLLELLGREDDQVKIRGHRIEPGEVEAALSRHPAVGRAVVLTVAGSRETHLAAVVEGPPTLSTSVLRDHLLRELPSFMVPAIIEVVDQLPLGASGKVDRQGLQASLVSDPRQAAASASANTPESTASP